MLLLHVRYWTGPIVELSMLDKRTYPPKDLGIASRLNSAETIKVIADFISSHRAVRPRAGLEIRLLSTSEIQDDIDKAALELMNVEVIEQSFTGKFLTWT